MACEVCGQKKNGGAKGGGRPPGPPMPGSATGTVIPRVQEFTPLPHGRKITLRLKLTVSD